MSTRKIPEESDRTLDGSEVHIIDFIHKNKLQAGVDRIWRRAVETIEEARVGFSRVMLDSFCSF